jgi:hypothetical protein
MSERAARSTRERLNMTLFIDPRRGDAEDDSSSTEQRSFLALAGTLLTEVSLAKLVLSWTTLIALPAALLGIAPLVVTGWLATVSGKITALAGIGSALLFLLVILLGWAGWRPLLRAAEQGFWSLIALAVQPGYALCREALRHLSERGLAPGVGSEKRARRRALAAACAGIVLCGASLGIIALVWPASRWMGEVADLAFPRRLIVPALANAVVLVGAYLAAASLLWGYADATMDQPTDLHAFDPPSDDRRAWRIAHLSDLHVVGERYGFRVESGRNGPRGNDDLGRVMARLEDIHADAPLDLILVTGDMTDAGRSAEWAEFLDLIGRHPALAERMLILPGNHDVNVVDRANPARLDLPLSAGKQLRRMRALSAMAAVQGDRVRVLDPASKRLGPSLSDALSPHREAIAAFADTGALRAAMRLGRLWDDVFPMVLPPEAEDGLGVVLLNSNAETHFSFTNALGLMPAAQARGLADVARQFPNARWIVALHHHLVEYPMPVKAFSERIGTALINGTWFMRQLQSLGGRILVMHGHRHIGWIGSCGSTRIVSAPSPIMGAATDGSFHIHTLARGSGGRLCLLSPETIAIGSRTRRGSGR